MVETRFFSTFLQNLDIKLQNGLGKQAKKGSHFTCQAFRTSINALFLVVALQTFFTLEKIAKLHQIWRHFFYATDYGLKFKYIVVLYM